MNTITIQCRIRDMEQLLDSRPFTQGLWLKLYQEDPKVPFIIDAYIMPGGLAKDIHDNCGPNHKLVVSGHITGGTPNIPFHINIEHAIRSFDSQG